MRFFRIPAVAAVLLWIALVLALGRLVLAFSPDRLDSFRRRHFLRAARALLWTLGVRVTVHGQRPEPPFLLVTNHLGYVDILVLASVVGGVFLSKAEVRTWPLLGWITAEFGTIYVDRADRRDIPRTLAAVEQAWSERRGVTLFPEGTSSSGATVEPFRSPLLALPARKGLPVHAAALSYRTEPGDPPAHLAVCWWGDMELTPHLLGLLRLRRVEATLDFCAEPLRERDRKLLAERLRDAVAARFQPVFPRVEGDGRLYGANE